MRLEKWLHFKFHTSSLAFSVKKYGCSESYNNNYLTFFNVHVFYGISPLYFTN